MLQLCQGNHGRNAEALHPFPDGGAFWEPAGEKLLGIAAGDR
jgi:hypothetical protein